MSKRTWRQCRETGKLIEVTPGASRSAPLDTPAIQPDIEPFVSPLDGTVIGSRRDLRQHNARHGVAQHQEYGESNGAEFFRRQERQRQERLQMTTQRDREERLRTLIPIVTANER